MNYFASDLLLALANFFQKEELNYLILRNYKLLPWENDSKDVDILLDPRDVDRASTAIIELAQEMNFHLVLKTNVDYLVNFLFLKRVNKDLYAIKVDFFKGFSWRGMTYLSHEHLFEESRSHEGLRVPSPEGEALSMIFYYILYGGNIPEKYRDVISQNAKTNEKAFRDEVRFNFSSTLDHFLWECIENNQLSNFSLLSGWMCREIVKRNLSFVLPLKLLRHVCYVLFVFRNPLRWVKNKRTAMKINDSNQHLFDLLKSLGINQSGYSLLKSDFFKYFL